MKVVKYLPTLLIAVMLVGCTLPDGSYVTPEQLTEQKGCEILNLLQDNDETGFKDILCQRLKDEHRNLDEEIHELFSFIDGDIVSYDDPYIAGGGTNTSETEGDVKKYIGGEIRHIKTTTDKEYAVFYVFYLIDKDQPEMLGVSDVCISLEDAHYDQINGYDTNECRTVTLQYDSENFTRKH